MEPQVHTQVRRHPRRASVAATKILQVGAVAAIASGFIMAAWQMVVAAIAQNPTTVHGIHQTLWTPPEGIWSVVFGVHHFHGSFHFIPVIGGIVGHMELAHPWDHGRRSLDRDPRSPAEPSRGSRDRGRLTASPSRRYSSTDYQHAEGADALQLDAALELVGRLRVLRRDARIAQQRAAEQEQRPALTSA